METGKVECAPDYESNKFSDFFREQKVDAEENAKLKVALEREWKLREFERAVIEAAKAWAKSFEPESPDIADLEIALQQAAINLIEFEELHQG